VLREATGKPLAWLPFSITFSKKTVIEDKWSNDCFPWLWHFVRWGFALSTAPPSVDFAYFKVVLLKVMIKHLQKQIELKVVTS
jgi:hypothetical protein